MNNIFELLGDYFVILALIPFCYIPVRDFPTRNKPTLTIQIIVSLSLFITVTLCTAIGFPGKTPQILTLPTAVYFIYFTIVKSTCPHIKNCSGFVPRSCLKPLPVCFPP